MAWPAGLLQGAWARSRDPTWGGSTAGVLYGAPEDGDEEAFHSHHLLLLGPSTHPQLLVAAKAARAQGSLGAPRKGLPRPPVRSL